MILKSWLFNRLFYKYKSTLSLQLCLKLNYRQCNWILTRSVNSTKGTGISCTLCA